MGLQKSQMVRPPARITGTRKEAVELGQLLMDRGAVRHVLDEHGFNEGTFFYRFAEDVQVHSPGAPSTQSA